MLMCDLQDVIYITSYLPLSNSFGYQMSKCGLALDTTTCYYQPKR